ncbi:MAG: ATP-binding protein [Desulfurococcales archaeon]|nr:ATP-binding protein [Desulfurococcales archaeon]
MIEVAVASGKGGVGKSTVAASLAIHLSKQGYSVVLADADAEAPNAHLVLGINSWNEVRSYSEGYIARIDYSKCTGCGRCAEVCAFKAVKYIGGRYVISELTCEGCLTCSLVCPESAISRTRVVAGEVRIVRRTRWGFPLVSSLLTLGRPNSGKLVTEVKNTARNLATDDSIIIIDSAAGIGCQVIASLAGAHMAVLIAEPTPASFSDLKRVHAVAKHFGIPSALIVNKSDINPDYTEVIIEYAKKEKIDFLGTIPYDEDISKSLSLLKPPTEAFPQSPASKALMNIAGVFEERVLRYWSRWRYEFKPPEARPYVPIIIKPSEYSISGEVK